MRATSFVCSVLVSLLSASLTHAEGEAPTTDAPKADAAPADSPKAEDAAPAAEATTASPAPAAVETPPAAPEAAPPAPAAAAQEEAPAGPDCPKGTALCLKGDKVAAWPRLRLRPGYELVQSDPEVLYVGNSYGFLIDQARFGGELTFNNLTRVKLTVDAASVIPGGAPNNPVNPLIAMMRDAYVATTLSPWFVVAMGQMTMPAEYESGDVDAVIPFSRKSVASVGVRAGHGYAVGGMSPQRQVGVSVGSGEGAALGPVGLEYALALANGNGFDVLGNDNTAPAGYVRIGAGFEDYVHLGLGGRYNPRTVGTLPNLYSENDGVLFGDLRLSAMGFTVVGEGIYRATSFTTVAPDPTNPAGQETGLGVTAWITASEPFGFSLFGLQPGYRISYYDPSSAFLTDQLLENTVGLRLNSPVPDLPISVFFDVTILTEMGEGARDLQNNRGTILLQVDL